MDNLHVGSRVKIENRFGTVWKIYDGYIVIELDTDIDSNEIIRLKESGIDRLSIID